MNLMAMSTHNLENKFVGFGMDQLTVKSGSRWSTYRAFVEPVLGRENLNLLRYSTVEKVNCDFKQTVHLSEIIKEIVIAILGAF